MNPADRRESVLAKPKAGSTPRTLAGPGALWLVLALLSTIVLSQVAVKLGVDANWDLRNYHLYNPFAVVEGRFGIDHNPAGIQTYINPTLDLLLGYPSYAIGKLQLATRLAGAVQGLNIVLIMAIVLALKGSLGTNDRRLHVLFACVATALGMTGALTISEIGTSFGDLTTAVAVLLGVLFALRSISEQDGATDYRLVAAAGLALGIAAGLKLTNGVYLVALGAGLAVLHGGTWLKTASTFGLAAMIGLLAAHGWWSWFLWQETGNPLFPFFNNLFYSPIHAKSNFFPIRFMPRNWWQALGYPFWFSWNNQTAEVAFRDFRFPIAYVLVLGLTAKLALQGRETDQSARPNAARRRLVLFTVFLCIAYVLWQAMFSIQRYAIAIEILLPAFILVALSVILRRVGWALFVVTAAFLAVTTHAANWLRLSEDRVDAPLISAETHAALSPILDNAAVILGGQPIGYVATAFPNARTTWVGVILSDHDLERARGKIALRSKLFILRRPIATDEALVAKKLNRLGLGFALPGHSACMDLVTVYEPLILCGPVENPRRAEENEQTPLPHAGSRPLFD